MASPSDTALNDTGLNDTALTDTEQEVVGQWTVRRTVGSSGAFHHRDPVGDDLEPGSATYRPAIWLHQPSWPALVLGSTQSDHTIDVTRARLDGWEVCRRRSGGGLVVVQPGRSVWIDVFIPPGHPDWSDDVGRAFGFLGRWWRQALGSLTAQPLRIHEGPMRNPEIGRFLCFGGIGPGEVLIASNDQATDDPSNEDLHKIVGLSQRRSSAGARFQGLALLHADNSPALTYGSPELRAAVIKAQLHGWPDGLARPTPDAVSQAFLDTAPQLLGRPDPADSPDSW